MRLSLRRSRPRIVHEPRLTVLREVCTVLRASMVPDQLIDDDEIEPVDDETEEDSEKNDEFGRLHLRRRDTIRRLPKIPPIQISSLVSIVTFVSRTFSETRVALQGTPSGYEIREKQSFNRLVEGAGLNQRETWFPTLPLSAT